jgi:hypothetical protein
VERAQVGLTNYTDLNRELVRRTGLAAFDFGQAADRAALGHLLGLVADRTFADSGLLISALVTYRHGDSPAAGFFSLAAEQGLIPAAATALSGRRSGPRTSGTCKGTTAGSRQRDRLEPGAGEEPRRIPAGGGRDGAAH